MNTPFARQLHVWLQLSARSRPPPSKRVHSMMPGQHTSVSAERRCCLGCRRRRRPALLLLLPMPLTPLLRGAGTEWRARSASARPAPASHLAARAAALALPQLSCVLLDQRRPVAFRILPHRRLQVELLFGLSSRAGWRGEQELRSGERRVQHGAASVGSTLGCPAQPPPVTQAGHLSDRPPALNWHQPSSKQAPPHPPPCSHLYLLYHALPRAAGCRHRRLLRRRELALNLSVC